MDLDRIQIRLRQRGIHESLDLGLRMHQRWSGPVYRAWLTTVMPCWLLLLAISIAFDVPWLGVFLIWWLKPLWDRIPLFVLSRAIFGATPNMREVYGKLTTLWGTGLFNALVRYRISPGRSLLMPITQLEGLRGAPAANRRRVLGRGPEAGGATGLFFAGFALEWLLAAGMISLVLFMVPDSPEVDFETVLQAAESNGGPLWARLLPLIGWLLAMSLVEPVYVAAGFALYLNRRTLLEGWDIELTFRRLARRIATQRGIVSALFLAISLSSVSVAHATSPPTGSIPIDLDSSEPLLPVSDLVGKVPYRSAPGIDEPSTTEAERASEVVFARPEFGYDREVQRWVARESPELAGFDLRPLVDWFASLGELDLLADLTEWFRDWFEEDEAEPSEETEGWFGEGMSSVVEILMWCIVAALLATGAIAMYRRRRHWGRFTPSGNAPTPTSITTIGHIRGPQKRVPPAASIPDQVWATWCSGDTDTALAMLYNAALTQLASTRALDLDQAWTEGDCARAVRAQVGGQPARYFQRVVRARTRVSYAHRPPTDDVVRTLCDDWSLLGSEP